MQKNMGNADRAIRLAIVVVIAALYFMGTISGTLAIILGIIALAFLVTSLIGWCPTYRILGLSTRRNAP
ncbi:MAG: DUF2892 domain-containing protein [Alphaproteobacteria bacterium]|nr:DUF2892 domain-containing protein [Alphaproteobacteria bacterium]